MYDDGIVLLDCCWGNRMMLGRLIGDWKKLIVKYLDRLNIKFNSFFSILISFINVS